MKTLLAGILALGLAVPAANAAGRAAANAADGTVSIDVKDGSVTDVLRLLAKIGGVNLVLDPAVTNMTTTVALEDVPWEQALDLVLTSRGLASVREGNVLRVAPTSKLIAEEQQAVQLREARQAAGPLRTVAIPLSYASATQAEAIVRKSLSSRGDTFIDRRTNTLFVTDVLDGETGVGALELVEPASMRHDAASSVSLGYDVKLFDGMSPVASSRVVLGVDQSTTLDLGTGGPSARVTLSVQRDGARTVLVVRAAADGGPVIGRALARDAHETLTLPGVSGRPLRLVLDPA
jgi:hypothetical protein